MVDALKANGWDDEKIKGIVIGGVDNYNGFLKLIKQGIADLGYEHSPYDNGYYGAEAAVLALRGAYLPKFWELPVGPITPDNIDKIVSMDQPDDYWLKPES
jgi:ABC-type sugar transport system substrate-binding protein